MKKDNTISDIHAYGQKESLKLPLFVSKISAGFPSPADDYIDKSLDLNEFLIKNPSATFFVKVSGDSMINAGIFHNDILIVDRSLELTNNKIIIANLNGELTIKRYKEIQNKKYLAPENPNYDYVEISEHNPFELWGIVIYVIHKV